MDDQSKRMTECLKSEKCVIPSECYRYTISESPGEKPKLESTINWSCVDEIREKQTKILENK